MASDGVPQLELRQLFFWGNSPSYLIATLLTHCFQPTFRSLSANIHAQILFLIYRESEELFRILPYPKQYRRVAHAIRRYCFSALARETGMIWTTFNCIGRQRVQDHERVNPT